MTLTLRRRKRASEVSEEVRGAEVAQPLEGSDSPRERESLVGVFGIGLGLSILLACVYTLIGYGTRSMAPTEALGGAFEVGAFPGTYQLEDEAVLLPSGERVVVISNGEEFEFDPVPVIKSARGGRGGMGHGQDFVPYDWKGIAIGAEGAGPARLYLVNYPLGRASKVLASGFRDLQWRELSDIGAEGGKAVVDGGKLEWAGYSADFVRERLFIKGGSFRDMLRVNLSIGSSCWVAYAIWPRESVGSTEIVREILGGLSPI